MTTPCRIVLLGASSEIGAALATRATEYSKENRVIAVSRKTGTESDQQKGVTWLTGFDLTKQKDLEKLASKVEKEFGEPFSVVHSVGDFWTHKPLVKTDFSEIERILSSHVLTLFGVARYLTPLMIARGGGRLVAFSCNSVGYSYPDMSPFTASKAAIESFVKCYANEHSEFNIAACALALPTIRTEAVLREKPRGDHRNYLTPNELAEILIDHLLEQSAFVNGNVVKIFKHSPSFYNSSYYERNPRQG